MENRDYIILSVCFIAIFALNLYQMRLISELSSRTVDLVKQNADQEEEITEILEQQVKTGKDIIFWGKSEIKQQVILNSISEDYPPKKKLGEREWCLNRTGKETEPEILEKLEKTQCAIIANLFNSMCKN